jgi:hypothetical protein
LRQLDRNEIFFRIKIVFARLIDYPQLTMARGLDIGNEAIDFARLKGRSIALVLHAKNEAQRCRFGSAEDPFDFMFFRADPMCFIPVNFSFANRTIYQFNVRHTL